MVGSLSFSLPLAFMLFDPEGPPMVQGLSFDLEALFVLWPLSSTISVPNLHSELQVVFLWILTLEDCDNVTSVDLSVQSCVSFVALRTKLNIVDPDTAARRRGDYGADAWGRHPVLPSFDPFLNPRCPEGDLKRTFRNTNVLLVCVGDV